DLSWLLGRGYAHVSALKLVGDRWSLTDRQRMAVYRSACPDAALARRASRRVEPEDLARLPIEIDGVHLLTAPQAALRGAVVLVGRDCCLRDVAGVHGTYRRVAETFPAAGLVGETLAALGAGRCVWHLDRPVSNSGRLRAILLAVAADRGWDWRVEIEINP